MRPSPIMTVIIALFLAVIGVFFISFWLTHRHDAPMGTLIGGVVCLTLVGVSVWGSLHWR